MNDEFNMSEEDVMNVSGDIADDLLDVFTEIQSRMAVEYLKQSDDFMFNVIKVMMFNQTMEILIDGLNYLRPDYQNNEEVDWQKMFDNIAKDIEDNS